MANNNTVSGMNIDSPFGEGIVGLGTSNVTITNNLISHVNLAMLQALTRSISKALDWSEITWFLATPPSKPMRITMAGEYISNQERMGLQQWKMFAR